MLRALDAPSSQTWLERLKLAFAQTSISRTKHPQPLAVVALPDLIRGRYRKFLKAAKRLAAASPAEDFHVVRGKVKKLRYTIETVADVYGKPAERFLRSLRRLQNSLGEQQDAQVAQLRLYGLAGRTHTQFTKKTMFCDGSFGRATAGIGTARARQPRRRLPAVASQALEATVPQAR